MEQIKEEISEKERIRREKISIFRKKYIKEKRLAGYRRYLEEKRKKMLEDGLIIPSKGRKKKKGKVGRPKKRGPKKKRKSRAKKIDRRKLNTESKQLNFKIVSCHNGKQDRYINVFRTEEDALICFNDLIKESNNVVFPQKNTANKKIVESEYTYLLLERNRFNDKENSMLKNKLGIIVEQHTNSEQWVIVNKAYYNIEETFWVYGYSPIHERKTYNQIFNNILLESLDYETDFKRVLQYKNKVIFKNDSGEFDIIFCKNTSDSIRLYNKLRQDVLKIKNKHIYFVGSYDEIGDRRRSLENELIEFTGWNKRKIQKSTT